jgi:hypothetical protein
VNRLYPKWAIRPTLIFANPQKTLNQSTCGHTHATARYAQPSGAARYLCRGCWRAALAAEAREIERAGVRAQWDTLFVRGPRITRSGGHHCQPLIVSAMPARIGAEGRAA